MGCAVEMGSGAMIYRPSFRHSKVDRGGTHTHRQQRKSRLKGLYDRNSVPSRDRNYSLRYHCAQTAFGGSIQLRIQRIQRVKQTELVTDLSTIREALLASRGA
jgi:hypothetical protein